MKKLLLLAARRIKSAVKPNDRNKLLRHMPKNAVCAEIGVWKGDFSGRILQETRPSALHLIDPWSFQPEFPDRMYCGKIAKEQQDMDQIYKDVQSTYKQNPAVKIHRDTSEAALTKFKNDYFDWVYIDGNHYYDYVKKDLDLSFLKVRPGGYIAGDDYDWGASHDYPVRQAVADFMKEHKINPQALKIIGNQFFIEKAAA